MRKIIPKPYFDKKGNWYIPKNIKMGGELNPKLSPREWLVWILLNSKNLPKNHLDLLGSRATIWRTKKKLVKKGYL